MEADVFWKKVKQILTELGRNQEWLCEQAKIPLSTLRNKICISRMPTFEEVMKILKVFNMTLEEFTAYPDSPQKDVINIPVYEQAFSAGRGQELPDSADIIDYVECAEMRADCRRYALKRKVAAGMAGNFRGVCPILNRATEIPTRYVLMLLAKAGLALLWRGCKQAVCLRFRPNR